MAFFYEVDSTLVRVLNIFFAAGTFSVFFLRRRVVLLPKPGEDPAEQRSYRPISLLTSDYKQFSSLLIYRLRSIIPYLCTLLERALFPRRSYSVLYYSLAIFFNLPYARTCLKGVFVGLDQSKAFDLVERDYLTAVLNSLGFP